MVGRVPLNRSELEGRWAGTVGILNVSAEGLIYSRRFMW